MTQVKNGSNPEEAATIQGHRRSGNKRYLVAFLLWVGWPIVFTLLVGLFEGKLIAQKVATNFVMPAGLIWVLLSGIVFWGWASRSRQLFWLGVVGWNLFSVLASPVFSLVAMRSLEQRYDAETPLDSGKTWDVLIVLGGGTAITPAGEPAVGPAGDRIVLTARMYLTGKAKQIICTGTTLRDDGSPSPGEATREILLDLGVPEDAILEMEGRTTSEEFVSIAKWQAEHEDLRIGLVTSAWHLPRAERLAAANGVKVDPIPADFRSNLDWDSRNLMPSARALDETSAVAKEYLAGLFGR